MRRTHVRHNYFSRYSIESPQETITRARKQLRRVDFDGFVVMGDSGLSVGVILAWKMNKQLLVLRKDGHTCHDWGNNYGVLGDRWVFLDDMIDSGATLETVFARVQKLKEVEEVESEFVGAYLFSASRPPSWDEGYFTSVKELVECGRKVQ
jgi:hypothetical protein